MDFLQNLIALPGPETVQNVFFPGLGLSFDLNRVAIIILGRPIYWYGIIIASGLILAVCLCTRWGVRYGVNGDQIIDLMLFAVPAALVAIRVYYVVFNLSIFQNEDGSLNLNPNSLTIVKDCYLEPNFKGAKAYDSFQFVRNGFFCVDSKDSTDENLVFNRIVYLKSSFKLPKA